MTKNSNQRGNNNASKPSNSWIRRLSWPLIILALVTIIAAWELGAHSHTPVAVLPKPDKVNHVMHAHSGPWGDLEYTRITIEVPDHFITINPPEPSRWFFKGYSRDQLESFFKTVGLTENELNSLVHKSEWKALNSGCWVVPQESLILGLRPNVRQKIYSILSVFPENPDQNGAFHFRPELLDERLAQSGLEDKTIALFKSLLYPQNSLLFFSDSDIVLSHLKDQHEKMRFIKTITRRTSLLVTLKVNDQTDLENLGRYWGRGGRSKDLRPILESLTRIPGGGSIDISHLLPPFVRQRIYTYPEPALDAMAAKENCHWSSLNFFNLTTDPGFGEPDYTQNVLQRDYYEIEHPSQLGDLIFLRNSEGMGVHSAVYIADDIVFTKNGAGFNQPWIYMQMDDLMPIYLEPNDSIKVVAYRRKDFSYQSASKE